MLFNFHPERRSPISENPQDIETEKPIEKSLDDLYDDFPQKSKEFYDDFFERGAKEIHEFLGLNFRKSILKYDSEENIISAYLETIFPKRTQTFDGRVHGGAVAAAFDAAMGIPIGFARLLPKEAIMVMKELSNIEIKKPVPTEQPVSIEITCDREEQDRKFWMSAVIKQNDEILATAKSFYLKVNL